MQRSKIDWADYVINPYIGCKHNCNFEGKGCWAKAMNKRFGWIKNWEEPEYQWGWQDKIKEIKQSSNIFIGSMTDLFGEWVESRTIQTIINECISYKEHNFLFLTKNPKRYREFYFASNCWLGTSISKISEINRYKELVETEHEHQFISFEPLLEDMGELYFKNIDWFIIGGFSGSKKKLNEMWIENFIQQGDRFGIPVFLKENANYKKEIKAFPEGLK